MAITRTVQNLTNASPGKVSTLENCYPREGTIEMKRNWDKKDREVVNSWSQTPEQQQSSQTAVIHVKRPALCVTVV